MAHDGFGVTLKVGGFTVSDMTVINIPDMVADTYDSTVHNATSRFKTYIKGLIDAGQFDVDCYFDYDNNAGTMTTFLKTTTLQSVTVTYPTKPSSTVFTCNGHVVGVSGANPIDGLIGAKYTIKISGEPTLAKG